MSQHGDASTDIRVVYDGQCPFCSSYARLYRIRERGSRVTLIDARSAHPLVEDVRRRGLDLDRGMVVQFGQRFYHGAEAMNVLAILGSGNTVFNRLNRLLFRHPRLAAALYPLLARGRLMTLCLLGRRTITDGRNAGFGDAGE